MDTSLSIRPSAQILTTNPNAKGLKIGTQAVTDLLDRQAQFRLVGDGKPSERTIVPLTPAAEKLLIGPDGERAQEILRGSLSVLDGRKGVTLNGISLSSSRDGAALNTLMSGIESGEYEVGKRFSQRSWNGLRDAVDSERQFSDSYLGVYYDEPSGWVTLAPSVSKQLMRATDGRTARSKATQFSQYVLAHELEHSVTPDRNYGPQTHWIEEGSAEVMSLQQRAMDARADAAGFPRREIDAKTRNQWLSSYSPYYHNLVNLLRFGGIEPGQAQGFAETRKILQEGATIRVPGRLARRIIQEQNLPEKHYETVRDAISGLGDSGSANDVRDLVRTLRGDQ